MASPTPPSIYPHLQQNLTPTSSGSVVCSYSSILPGGGPILILIHGYPQSAFIWRHVIPHLIDKISLFVPELPGYGISTACSTHSKRTVGGALIEALSSVFNIPPSSTSTSTPQPLILCGHDRGARICHRLAVDASLPNPNLKLESCILIDIVPTLSQWNAFASPAVSVGYFHWPFLANASLAAAMIQAFGGDRWCRGGLLRIQGSNEKGRERFAADGAHDLYSSLFKKPETIIGSCEDYAAEAEPEVKLQTADQEHGRKIDVPTLVMFSKAGLGARLDVAGIWRDWVAEATGFKAVGVGEGYGHYLPEEAPEEITQGILEWIHL